MSDDQTRQIQSRVNEAVENKSALNIQAGNSKHFYGRKVEAALLDMSGHTGIISYQPTELVITARAGTRLNDINEALKTQHQMLAFEPPGFSETATLGGTIACNLSGPRRAYSGAARDYVLGCTLINGKAEVLKFGGEVMKNVAGYDASRLMCGAMGTLGVLLDISLKVLPVPEAEITLVQQLNVQQALDTLHQWARSSLPISASCYDGEQLYIRLSGSESAISTAKQTLSGETLKNGHAFWNELKEQQHDFFKTDKPLWRLSLASTTAPLKLGGDTLIEWGGALRWLKSDDAADKIRHQLEKTGASASLFRNASPSAEPFHELSPGLLKIHQQLKQAFDPLNIFNPARMYSGI